VVPPNLVLPDHLLLQQEKLQSPSNKRKNNNLKNKLKKFKHQNNKNKTLD
jgi:hypothetical protein